MHYRIKQVLQQLCLLLSFTITIQLLSFAATAQLSGSECVSRDDLTEISQNFEQFAIYIKEGQSSYCESDVGAQWIKVLNSLVLLKKLQPAEVEFNEADAFTYKAIEESNWWAYFIARAKNLQIPEQCRPGVGAFVFPFFMDSTIYLCPPFFESSVTSQASILMHEVRHFDGHSHVSCTRGLDTGSSGACDMDILNKGSYAISVQTLVGMSRIPELEPAAKNLLEAEAIYTAFNRFNAIPKVKINEAIILSNTQGEVYRWNMGDESSYEKIGDLNEPARIYNSYNNLTIYPLDPTVDAYRMDKDLNVKVPSIGLFAVYYNKETVDQRALYTNVTYLGDGGLLKENQLITFCNNESESVLDLADYGNMKRIIAISKDEVDSEYVSLLVSETGELYQFNCAQRGTADLTVTPYGLSLAPEVASLQEAFGLGGKMYGVLASGQMTQLEVDGDKLLASSTAFPFENKNWVSATPLSRPEIFSE